MAVTRHYDKFDERFTYFSESHLLNNHSGSQGTYWGQFAYFTVEGLESGFLFLRRQGADFLWVRNSQVVILTEHMRFKQEPASDLEALPAGGVSEELRIYLTKEECQALVSAGTSVEGRAGLFQFTFGQGLVSEIARACKKEFDTES